MNNKQRDDLQVHVRKMKEHADSIAKTVSAREIKSEYEAGYVDTETHTVYLSAADFKKAFGDQATTLVTDRDSTVYPFERSILVEGVKFYCILDVEDLSKEENMKRICSELDELLKLKKEIEAEDGEEQ